MQKAERQYKQRVACYNAYNAKHRSRAQRITIYTRDATGRMITCKF